MRVLIARRTLLLLLTGRFRAAPTFCTIAVIIAHSWLPSVSVGILLWTSIAAILTWFAVFCSRLLAIFPQKVHGVWWNFI
jgi:hypothetical protein